MKKIIIVKVFILFLFRKMFFAKKTCETCKYFIPGTKACKLFIIETFRKKIEFVQAENIRNDKMLCGPDAKHHAPFSDSDSDQFLY